MTAPKPPFTQAHVEAKLAELSHRAGRVTFKDPVHADLHYQIDLLLTAWVDFVRPPVAPALFHEPALDVVAPNAGVES